MSSHPPPPDPHNSAPHDLEPVPLRPDPATLATNSPAPIQNKTPSTESQKPAPIWLQRISLLVQVMFCIYLGILLVILPWWPHLLESNELLSAFPQFQNWLTQGAVRGVISGVGLIDIWIGISEVINYHEVRN